MSECLVPIPGGGEQPACSDPLLPTMYWFNPTPTENRTCCFLGIWNQPGRPCTGTDIFNEAASGRICGFGCEVCKDDSTELLNHVEFIDGDRWLAAEPIPGQRYWDARGQVHDLKSGEYHPIPGDIIYERGQCWDNDGQECFRADACSCFGTNTISPIAGADSTCTGGIQIGDEIPGERSGGALLPDLFFATGQRWPPIDPHDLGILRVDTQLMGQFHCRKFSDTRNFIHEDGGNKPSKVDIEVVSIAGLSGATEGLMPPVFLSANVCHSNALTYCTGRFEPRSPCYFFSAHGVCTQANSDEVCSHTFYSFAIQGGRFPGFDYLLLNTTAGNEPRILAREDAASGLQAASAGWKNRILDAIRTEQFPVPGDPPTTTSFDRLDHQAKWFSPGNSGIGIFKREWWATGDPNDGPVGVTVMSGEGRLMQTGCRFAYDVRLVNVKVECRLVLQQIKVGRDLAYAHIETHARLHMIGVVLMYIRDLTGPDGTGDCLSPGDTGAPMTIEYVQSDGLWRPLARGPGGFIDGLRFFDEQGEQYLPTPVVEWRGFLGGHSRPSAIEQRFANTGPEPTPCDNIVARLSAVVVPGWPTEAGSHPDTPAQMYGGQIRLGFSP